jgi:serine protease Do
MQGLISRRDKKLSRRSVVAVLIVVLVVFASCPAVAQDAESIEILEKVGKAFHSIAKKASPAVVGIKANRVIVYEHSRAPEGPFGNPFDDDLFKRFFHYRSPRSQPQQKSYRPVQGSGFIVSADGHILTNNHVVEDSEQITVTLLGGQEYDAEVVGTDPETEVAVIKIDAENLPFLELADSDQLEVGEWVIAIGNPFGLSHTVTAGIVSAKGRSGFGLAGPEGYEDFIQTDAAINFGNSGGPLINLHGNVVGINTAIIGPGGNIGIGFAIPANMAKFVYDRVIKGETIKRGLLGVYPDDLSPDMAELLGIEGTKGVVIETVVEESPAEKAGIRQYDVVVEFNGEKVERANDFRNRVAMTKPGTKVKLVIVRDGKRKTVTAELGDKSEDDAEPVESPSEAVEKLGLSVQDLTDELAEYLGYQGKSGVVVTSVEPGSEVARKGISPRMLITEINRKAIEDKKEFEQAMEAAAKNGKVLVLVYDGTYNHLIVLKLPKE